MKTSQNLFEKMSNNVFSGWFPSWKSEDKQSEDSITEAFCLFAVTTKLTCSSSVYVPIITTGGLKVDLNNNGISADAGSGIDETGFYW